MEDAPNEIDELESRIAKRHAEGSQGKGDRELNKLKMMSPMSAEATVVRNYIDWLLKVPWKKRSKVTRHRPGARRCWTRITTASRRSRNASSSTWRCSKRVKNLKGPILCLVGPPGVGKTSLGQSIARATNRKFVRMSLGGCATKRRSVAIAAPTSARCRARSAEPGQRQACEPTVSAG